MLKRTFIAVFAVMAMATAMVVSAADAPAALNFKAKDIDFANLPMGACQ